MSQLSRFRDDARRLVLWTALLVTSINVGTGLTVDSWATHVRFADAEIILAAARQLPASPDIVFLGSSIMGSMVDWIQVENVLEEATTRRPVVFAAAVNGADAATMRHVFARLEAEGTRPRHLIVEIAPEVLSPPPPFLGDQVVRFLSVRERLANVAEILRSSRARSKILAVHFIPLFLYRAELLRWLGVPGTELPCPPAGPMWLPEPGDAAEVRARSGFVWKNPLARVWSDFAIANSAAASITMLVGAASTQGVRVTLLIPPVSTALRAFESAEGWKTFDRFVASISRVGCPS